MKKILSLFVVAFFSFGINGQTKTAKKPVKKPVAVKKSVAARPNPDLVKINDSIPVLIPRKKEGKFGFVNQKGKVLIPHQYSNVGFFTEDCNLLNSPNENAKKFGTNRYASVRLDGNDYRINQAGKRVYQFKESDLGKCPPEFKQQIFHSYVLNGFYGVIEDSKFNNEMDYRQYQIYPQFQYLHIMEGDDLKNPMIIAVHKDRFGVIDIYGKVIVPFQYSDIKRNFSWKLARLFEVTKDGENYYFVDDKNNAY